ncbi:hypothetical protein RhiirC2_828242, partial [Rhizophagus irregularis]
MLQQFKNRNKSRFNSYADATKGNRNPSNRHRHWNQNNIITQQRNNNTYTFNEEEMQAWGDEEDINDNNHNPIQDGTRKGGSMHDPNTNKRTSSQNDLSDFKKQLTTLNTMIIEFRKENDIVRKEINSIKKTFKNNNNCKGPQHKPNKLPIVNNNNKRAKPDSSSTNHRTGVDMNNKINMNTHVINQIKIAKSQKMEIICCGNFNLQYKRFKKRQDNKQSIPKMLKMFQKLEDLNLWDVHKETYDMDNTKEIMTYFGRFNSRIDYIWISENFFTKTLNAKIINISDIIKTDHALLTFDFINEDLIYLILQTKKLNTTNTNLIRHIFDFDTTEEKDLLNFQDDLKKVAISFNLNDKAGYKIISHNDNKNAIGKGVMLIIRNNLEKHIFNIEKINGRILIVDFSFKNNKKLRLILFYNLASHRTGEDINNKINMNTQVIKQIKIAKSKKMEIICCGDFNLQYRRFKKRQDNKQSIPKMLKIFQKLEDLNLWDIHKETYDMDHTKEIMTYFGRFNSRIDYIWISENLFTKTSNAKIINIRDIIKTDHALLTFDFINEDLIYPILQTKKLNTTNTNLIRHIFDFDNTEEKDLFNFQDDLKKVAISFNFNGSIEEKWSFFKHNLLKIKQQHIRSKEIIVNIDCDKTFQHTQLYKDLRYIVYLRRKFKKKLSFERLALNWKNYSNYLKHLVKRHSIDEVNSTYLLLQHRLSRFLIGQYVKELNEIYDSLFSKFSLEMFNLKNEKIKEAVDKRCADLADNQRRMIDNITENEIKKIFIDRVLIDDEEGNSFLVTDENKIKDITRDHFQNAAGSKNRTIEDLHEWFDEYEPIRSINELIYNNCLEPITDDEWNIVIKDLPIKKAVGPTGIAYDEIKKAPSEFNHLLRDIINEVLHQILTLDGKNLLTLKEILGKRFKKFFSPNRSLIEKSWKIIEDCLLDNKEVIKRRISFEAKNKIGTSFAHNLKGTILTKMNSDSESINNGFIFGKKKFNNDIILVYGKNYNLGSQDIILEHYITVNNPDDLFMGLQKCLGCGLDETSTIGPLERIYKKSNCLVKLRIEDVYFLENYLHSHAMIIQETDSYIVPDIIQSHIESNIWHEHKFIIEPTLFKQDDIRLNIFDFNMRNSTQNFIEKYVKKEKFNKNLTIEKLNVINYKLIQQFGEQIFIYIDGSVINNGTENIDGIAGLHFYDKDHNLIEEFYVNIEHWISPSKAEVTSFILALLVVYNINNVDIITDNEFILNYFNDIICKTEIYNTRKLLKTQNNIYIWALIRQFIDLNEIIIPRITKIKAHDDNVYHNFLDQQIKNRYSDRNRVYSVNFNFFQLDKIDYMLTWNNIIIEKPIRRFIRYYNEILNLEKFFNLRRNRKYTIDSVEWAITFEFLKENENVLQTNFHTTKRRRYKIKNLIEEIPTVEQKKLINFDIYKDWKCPVCERKKETFGHVWRCYSNRKRMRNIIYYSIICLIEKIKEYDIYTFDETKLIDLFINESFGEVKVNNNKLTFVDIIK